MPNYDIQKKEQPEIPTYQPQTNPEITDEKMMKTMRDILLQRMSDSEVELMKAENAELKQILGNFGKNYNKFEGLIDNMIRLNGEEQRRLMSELHGKQEQKLHGLKTSNEMLSKMIESTITNMKDEIRNNIASLYEKIDKSATERLKKYNESIKELEKQSKRFWAFTGIKEALFWCMCLAIIFIISRATLDVWGVQTPDIVWQILYPCSFIPFIGYTIREIVKMIKEV